MQRLADIAEDAGRMAIFIDGMSLTDFLADERTIFAVERLLQRITEATIQIDAVDVPHIEGIPFAKMRAFGNVLRHEYGEIDRRTVFEIARIEVPLVGAAAELALES